MKAEWGKEREQEQEKRQEQGKNQKNQKGIAISDAEWAVMKALWEVEAAQAGIPQAGATPAGAAQAGIPQAGAAPAGDAQAGVAQAGVAQRGAAQAGATRGGASRIAADQAAGLNAKQAAAQEAGLTLRQIDEAVKAHGWGYSTVRTMVGRLVEKGAIIADKSRPGNFLYYPAVSEEVCRREEVRSFVDRVFGGSARLLVSALVDEQKLSAEEEAALMAIIDKME